MAKKKKKKKQGGYVPPPVDVDAVIAEIEALLPVLETPEAGPEWGQVQKLLVKAKADTGAVARAVISRQPDAIRTLILVLRGEAELEAPPVEAPLPEIPDEELRSAMKAYRKRLKLIKLDHESKLGRSPLSGGKDAGFESIIPPEQWAPEVWKVLAAKGELESTGQGFYKLPDVRRSF